MPDDAKSLTIPTASFTSAQEDTEPMKAFHKAINENLLISSSFVTNHYPENHHGFAGARANLEDPSNLAAYKDVYERAAKFVLQHLA